MRILVSNPDTLGDLILRQPMLAAIQEAGHELALVMRPQWTALAPMIAPGARVLAAPGNVYDPELTAGSAQLAAVAAAARQWQPEVLVVAPFQWTVLEERLSLELAGQGVPTVVMTGRLFGDPSLGAPPASGMRNPRLVQVTEETPETRKNEQLAGAVLGKAVTLPQPKLSASGAQLDAARTELSRLGLKEGTYWVCCIGDTEHTAVRNWRPERWAQVLGEWAKRRGRRFLFVGHESEAATTHRIADLMGDQRGAGVDWFGAGDASLDTLVGLTALSAGYVGRDTGPMHMAAALGKPVLAVFGGGTWPRFLPAAEPSVSVAVAVPCMGCGWQCHLEESYCIKDVPASVVMEAAEGLEEGRITGRVVQALPAGDVLLSRIGREGASVARERLALLSMGAEHKKTEASVPGSNGKGVTEAVVESVPSLAEPKTWAPATDDRVQRLTAELKKTRAELGQAKARIAELEIAGAEFAKHRAEQAGQMLSTRQLYTEAKARVDMLETKFMEKVGEAAAAKEGARIREALEAATRKQYEEAQMARIKAEEVLANKSKRLDEATVKMKDLDAKLRTAEALGPESSRVREAQLREQLADARARLAKTEGEAHDLRLRMAKFDGEKAAIQRLAQENEAEVVVLRGRVRDLAASRWRKLGQKLHLAMTLPWEENGGNGKPASR